MKLVHCTDKRFQLKWDKPDGGSDDLSYRVQFSRAEEQNQNITVYRSTEALVTVEKIGLWKFTVIAYNDSTTSQEVSINTDECPAGKSAHLSECILIKN